MGSIHMYKKLLVVALVVAFVLSAGAVLAQQPSATISIIDVGQAIGVGPIWGQGVITYGGKTHLFKVKGFEKLAVGREKMDVNGDVYHLNQLSDLAGKYKKADPAGLTFIKVKRDLVIQNEKGVVINLKGKEHGLQLDLVKDGLTIKDIQY
jgi:hypothetical protein